MFENSNEMEELSSIYKPLLGFLCPSTSLKCIFRAICYSLRFTSVLLWFSGKIVPFLNVVGKFFELSAKVKKKRNPVQPIHSVRVQYYNSSIVQIMDNR